MLSKSVNHINPEDAKKGQKGDKGAYRGHKGATKGCKQGEIKF